MARRSKSHPRGRLLLALAVAAIVAAVLWRYRERLADRFGPASRHADAVADVAPERVDPANEGRRLRFAGKLSITAPAYDAQLGIRADAAMLLRDVEMFAWREVCTGERCRYETAWSAQPEDSHKFREPAGHENPPAPFAGARFAGAGLHLRAYEVDPALAEAQLPSIAFAVDAGDLPPNLAATFRGSAGVLYAGGDPAQPRVGTLKVSYRVVPLGEVTLSGVQHGGRIAAQ